MPRNIAIDCFLETIGRFLEAREAGDRDAEALAASEAERYLNWAIAACTGSPSADEDQLARIRETITATVEDWLRDYGIPDGEEHRQLVNRIAAAVLAMQRAEEKPPPKSLACGD